LELLTNTRYAKDGSAVTGIRAEFVERGKLFPVRTLGRVMSPEPMRKQKVCRATTQEQERGRHKFSFKAWKSTRKGDGTGIISNRNPYRRHLIKKFPLLGESSNETCVSEKGDQLTKVISNASVRGQKKTGGKKTGRPGTK